MASHANYGGPSGLPLSAALSVIPSLPRALLARLVERAIERLDELDGDADLEDGADAEPCDDREPDDGDFEPDYPEAREAYRRPRLTPPTVHYIRHGTRTWRVSEL